MKMIKPRMSKGVAVAALMGVCVAAWGFSASAAFTNLALQKTVVVSSVENNTMPGSNITDGDTVSRWGSAWTDSQWAYIDFGAATTFDSIAIWWEHSNAVEYTVQTSNTATSNDQGWTTLVHPTNDTETIPNDQYHSVHRYFKLATPSNARYLKIRCIKRHYQWGYSIHEVQVFNTQGTPGNRVDIALHKTATADSYRGTNTPDKAVDSIYGPQGIGQGSRWENAWDALSNIDTIRGNAWLCVDLGAKYLIDSVAIYWEHSGSGKFAIQVPKSNAIPPSSSDTGWTTLLIDTTLRYEPLPVDMGRSYDKLPQPTTTRFVRVHSYKRLAGAEFAYGISIEEFQVFGTLETSVRPAAQRPLPTTGLVFIKTNNGVSILGNSLNKSTMSTDIFSPNGQLICHLSCANTSFWNYKDAFGKTVTNGTYLLRVTSAGKTIQEKIAVFR